MAKKNPLKHIIEKDEKAWKREKRNVNILVGNEAKNFFQDNFKRQGFKDEKVNKWKKRKNKDSGRAILVKTGALRRSIRVLSRGRNFLVVGSTKKYAAVHNEGLRSGRPRGGSFNMPQRRFIGKSKTLDEKITKLIVKRISKAFKS